MALFDGYRRSVVQSYVERVIIVRGAARRNLHRGRRMGSAREEYVARKRSRTGWPPGQRDAWGSEPWARRLFAVH